jgi:hypothetical protein
MGRRWSTRDPAVKRNTALASGALVILVFLGWPYFFAGLGACAAAVAVLLVRRRG